MSEPVGWVDDGGLVFWKDKPPPDGANLYISLDGAGQDDMQSLPLCFTCNGTGTHPLGHECHCDSGLRPEPMGAIERLRNGGQPDLADQVDREIREAYEAGRRNVMEHLERIGAVSDCPSCGGRGEKMVAAFYGPDAYQEVIDCVDCNGTGYALVKPA